MEVNKELEEKAVEAIRAYINGDYSLPKYFDENSFIRLADEAKGLTLEDIEKGNR